MANWADLHPDILSQIIKKITNPCDHKPASQVCSSWRTVAKQHRPTLPVSIPGLILSTRDSPHRKFTHFQPRLPFFVLEMPTSEACHGSSKGWLVIGGEKLSLYNPFSTTTHPLPNLSDKTRNITKVVLSSSPFQEPNCMALMMCHPGGLAFCRLGLGDDSWTSFEESHSFSDALFFEKKVFLVDAEDIDELTTKLIHSHPTPTRFRKFYLALLEGQVCRVERKYSFYNQGKKTISSGISTQGFSIVTMDPENGSIVVNGLHGNALFLGCHNTLCLDELVLSGKIPGDRIYFTDDRLMKQKWWADLGKDMGVYDFGDMSLQALLTDELMELMEDNPGAQWLSLMPW